MVDVISHAVIGSIKLSVKLILIIVPLMVAYEFLENSKIFNKILDALYILLKPLGFSKQASISMLTGIFLGITYGSGILLSQSDKGKLTKIDILLSAVYLSMCHAVIEDTLVFVVIGGNGFYILITRLIIATTMTYLFYLYFKDRLNKA
ncbi:nucleoside recognition domain-containing protein [Hippea maritima]|uniref:Nucleoside recognition domain protein n=1 Tax=Hippea maritima (strain ATCC 700847 / DSM 10411 / MH2) TaxID=760142 RepID=F2LY18_HIPMA|nr:nucleoside recognition domain-containing protein [Hippea maritima]AEA33283.1 nucleoside recognition domain protein [Hippea maritima DSM 10411]